MDVFNLTSDSLSERCLRTIYRRPLVVLQGGPENFRNFEHHRQAETYLLTSENRNNLKEILKSWTQVDYFNPRAKFWFLTDDNHVSGDVFKIFADFYIANVAVIARLDQIYTYFPYKYNEDVGRPDVTPAYLGDCENFDQFLDQSPKFWRNTTIKVLTKCMTPYIKCARKIGGIETEIFGLIRNILKFKVRRIIDNDFKFGLEKRNGQYSASFARLQNNEVDMAMGGFRSIGQTQFLDFDFSTNHLEDRLVWVVPKALPIVQWVRIVLTFDWFFWLALMITAICMAIIVGKVSRFTKEVSKNFSRKFPLDIIFQTLVSGYLKQTPQRLQMRIIYIFWIYFCMLVDTVFNSNLMKVFFASTFSYQINSFIDIIKSNLEVGLTDDVMTFLKKDPDWDLLNTKREVFACAFGTGCLNRTILRRDLACCWAERSIKYRMANFYQTNVHFIDDHLLFFFVVFYFVKGYPMVPQISRLITQLRSTGLVQYISSKVDKRTIRKITDYGSKILDFETLKGPFYFLYIGWFVAFLVFLGELVRQLKNKRK